MKSDQSSFPLFLWRVTATHMTSYFLMGIIAFFLLDYENLFSGAVIGHYMKPTDSPWVAAGPMLQIFRGIIFSIALWPVRSILLFSNKGWLKLWLLLVGLSILSTAGPSPSSVEGIIYTKLPLKNHLLGLPETLLQTLLFSWWLTEWYRKPSKLKNILFIIAVLLIVFFGLAAIFTGEIQP